MRADPHYVEQLDSSYAGPVIRLIATRQIDAGDPPAPARLEALSQSIAAHGIVQPLLVRRHNGRYQLIAGRKRLAAAVAAGVAEVPCVMYEVDEQEAAALAQADNLRFTQPQDQSQPPIDAEWFQQLLKALSADLASITSSTAILRSAPTGTFLQHRVAADLIQAQAWRAAWSVGATGLVTGQHRAGRTRPIGAILDGVKAGFESESRLSGLQVETIVSANAASIVFDDDACGAAVIGAVLTTLSWLEGIEEPRIEIRADVPRARTSENAHCAARRRGRIRGHQRTRQHHSKHVHAAVVIRRPPRFRRATKRGRRVGGRPRIRSRSRAPSCRAPG
ncbi:MAG: hypothetical protein DMD46_17025 [Gemmatimonadetes bacterium]|nr:MAG: hypothetical protein DMD46_17025 [Gemmatimonadota bacterium]